MIGIAGGAGPFAGSELFRKIIEETKALSDQEHLPVILWSEPALIPDRTEYLDGNRNENPATGISNVFLALEKAGATVAAIPCNTAHAPAIFDEVKLLLQKADSRLTLVNIVEETLRFLHSRYQKGTSVGVLSTTGTWRCQIYKQALEKGGYHVLEPLTIKEQQDIHLAIYDKSYGVKAHSSPVTDKARTIFLRAIDDLINRGAEVIILGCTEIPVAITAPDIKNIPLVDTTRVLARSLIRYFAPQKLKE
jgi:aspartate racemase